ncbi:MAG: hemolysin III family protein, partial [Anaerolineae bacterium]
MLRKFRDPVSGLTHLGGAVAALVGLVALLLIGWGSWTREASLSIYGVSLILMMTASACYHLIKASPRWQLFLRKLDHSAIYILIAGTYTPVCMNLFSGFWNWGMLAIIWTFALVGTIVKLFVINAPRWVTVVVYIVMGWLGILAVPQMIGVLPAGALFWLLLGGVVFTLGAVVYATKKFDFFPNVFGFHE